MAQPETQSSNNATAKPASVQDFIGNSVRDATFPFAASWQSV
jgi:hypothetical protein